MEPLLEVEGIATDIGQFHILENVSFQVPKHQVTVLMGRNGAGKTTTLRTIMGFLQPHQGEIRFEGQEIQGKRPWEIPRLGIGYVPEDANIFDNLTVEENLRIGIRKHRGQAEANLRAAESLFPDLRVARHRLAGHLSGGQRQMLAIAGVLADVPDLLLIDEPSKGLSPLFVDKLGETLQEIRGQTTILLVEQNFYLAARVGDTYTMLEDGHCVAAGPMDKLVESEELQDRYLGVRVGEEV